MATECRRVVTGHTLDGRSTVLYDSCVPLVEMVSRGGTGLRKEDRKGSASAVLWTTEGLPAENNGDSDAGLRKVNTAEENGTILRVVQYAPGVTPRHHRTESIDYAVVISGSIKLELDDGTVKLNMGDILIQRGTIHNWINDGTEPCVMFYALIGAHPVALKNGVILAAKG